MRPPTGAAPLPPREIPFPHPEIRPLSTLLLALLASAAAPLTAQEATSERAGGIRPVETFPDTATADTTIVPVPPVVVTATRLPHDLATLAASAVVVDREALARQQALTLDEAVDAVPGVDVVGSGLFGQEVRLNLRGLTNGTGTQRSLVLMDGRPVTDEYLGAADASRLPVHALERVEVVLGPGSAVHGSNAMGGVINLVPRRGGPEPTAEVATWAGAFGSLGATALHGRTVGSFDLLTSVAGLRTDGYVPDGRGGTMGRDLVDVFVNVGREAGDHEVRLYAGLTSDDRTEAAFEHRSLRTFQDLSVALPRDDGGETRVRLDASQLDQTLDWRGAGPAAYRQHTLGAAVTEVLGLGVDHHLLAGASVRRAAARVDELAGPVDRAEDVASVFVQDELALSPRVRLQAGIRGDLRPGPADALSFRTGLHVRPSERTGTWVAAARSFRAPTLSDRYLPATAFQGLVFEGNPDLGPEVLWGLEGGLSHDVARWLHASVAVFASRVRGMWDYVEDADGVHRPRNITRVSAAGLEVGTRARLAPGLELSAGYALHDARYRAFAGSEPTEGNRLDENVRHQGTVALAYRHAAGHALRIGVQARGDRYTDPANSPGGRLGGHQVVDARVTVALTDALALRLAVENALDRTYRLRPEFAEPGRWASMGLAARF